MVHRNAERLRQTSRDRSGEMPSYYGCADWVLKYSFTPKTSMPPNCAANAIPASKKTVRRSVDSGTNPAAKTPAPETATASSFKDNRSPRS